jgi:GTPase Era involved in 16S rRNA processing
MSDEREDGNYIRCIGVDGKQHICEPQKDTCYCGVKVKTKKPQRDDYKRFSCYECTY